MRNEPDQLRGRVNPRILSVPAEENKVNCCATSGTNKYFSGRAGTFKKKFRRRGLDKPSRLISDALTREGIQEKTLLDIGCGAGGLHLTLLQRGARSAQGVEIAEGMLEAARSLATQLGLADKVMYIQGDFVRMNGGISQADVVILDKVVCCYPEYEELIAKSADKAADLYAVSFPRDAVIPKLGFRGIAWLGDMLKWSFHPYYHNPAAIGAAIQKRGFREVYSGWTALWSVKVFRRESTEMR